TGVEWPAAGGVVGAAGAGAWQPASGHELAAGAGRSRESLTLGYRPVVVMVLTRTPALGVERAFACAGEIRGSGDAAARQGPVGCWEPGRLPGPRRAGS